MFCEKYKNIGILYLYDELNEKTASQFEAHMQSCLSCREELFILTSTVKLVHRLPVETVSHELLDKVLKESKQRHFNPVSDIFSNLFNPLLWPRRRFVLTAFAVAMLIFLGLSILQRSNQDLLVSDENLLAWNYSIEEKLIDIEANLTTLLTDDKDEMMFKTEIDDSERDAPESSPDELLDYLEKELESLTEEYDTTQI